MHARLLTALLALLALPWIGIDPASAAPESPGPLPAATATLPLEEVLELHRSAERANETPAPPPPIDAAVSRIELRGRLLDRGVELTAKLRVVVLQKEQWVKVPLFRLDSDTSLTSLPQVRYAELVARDGRLYLVTNHAGSFEFEVSLEKRAQVREGERSLALELADASLATCELVVNERLFALRSEGAIFKPEGVLLFPRENRIDLAWAVRESTAPVERAELPEIESTIPLLHAQMVSTLEGERVVRLLYRLRFAGEKQLRLDLPEGQVLERAYLNGFPVPLDSDQVSLEGRALALRVRPGDVSDQQAQVELVLSTSARRYNLAGEIDLVLPRAEWPIAELYVDLHLPAVFNYRWASGSLAPVDTSPAVRFSDAMPEPGKKLSFHQYLVRQSAADVRLDYAVDLEDQYYCPEPENHRAALAP